MHNRKTIMINIILCLILFSGIGRSETPQPDTGTIQNIKAAFIYNFTKYMTWTHPDQSSTFDIAVIGESPVLAPLEEIARKRRVGQKEIQIRHFDSVNQMDRCQILFIPESEYAQLDRIVQRIRGENILIVSEIEGELANGVMINFLISKETIKFEINLNAMKQAGFEPGSELLKLAVRLIE